MFRSFLYWGTLNWTQHSSYGLTSAEQKERITSLNLLAILYLITAKDTVSPLGRKDIWLTHVQCCVHQEPQVLVWKTAFQVGCSECVLVLHSDFSSPDAGLCTAPSWTSWFLSAQHFSLSRSPGESPSTPPTPPTPSFMSSINLLRVHSTSFS